MPRRTDWVDTILNEVPTSGGQASDSLLGGLSEQDTRGLTLIRMILAFSLTSESIAGAYGIQSIDVGVGVVSQEAFAAGIFPDPVTASDKPPRGWIYRTNRAVAQNGAGSPIIQEVLADIRGARMVENGELVIIVNNSNIVGTSFTCRVRGLVRCLFKLP